MSDLSNLSKKENRELKNYKSEDVSKKPTNEVSILEKLNTDNLPELQGWKEKQETLVKENPYVEIIDNKTYETACKSRTALLKGRTSLEGQEKLVASKIATFRKSVGDKTKELISITLPHEEKQQTEVKRYEGIKEAERLERERIENDRISGIKTKIESIESDAYKIIQQMDYNGIASKSNELSKLVDNEENDFEEFDILFNQAKLRIENAITTKVNDLTEKENTRKENERLARENAEAQRKSNIQSSRLNELLPYNAFGEVVDMATLWALNDDVYSKLFKSKKALFDADALAKEKAEKERKAREKVEKEKVFDIRVNRLKEIGLDLTINSDEERSFFIDNFQKEYLTSDEVFNADTLEFEELLLNAKNEINSNTKSPEPEQNAITEIETVDAETVEEKPIVIDNVHTDVVVEGNEPTKTDFTNDKKALIEFIESLEFHSDVPEMENDDFHGILDSFIEGVIDYKKELIETVNQI